MQAIKPITFWAAVTVVCMGMGAPASADDVRLGSVDIRTRAKPVDSIDFDCHALKRGDASSSVRVSAITATHGVATAIGKAAGPVCWAERGRKVARTARTAGIAPRHRPDRRRVLPALRAGDGAVNATEHLFSCLTQIQCGDKRGDRAGEGIDLVLHGSTVFPCRSPIGMRDALAPPSSRFARLAS
jgi:hypothetical protein